VILLAIPEGSAKVIASCGMRAELQCMQLAMAAWMNTSASTRNDELALDAMLLVGACRTVGLAPASTSIAARKGYVCTTTSVMTASSKPCKLMLRKMPDVRNPAPWCRKDQVWRGGRVNEG
jgi:hypothetical protein